MAVEAGRAALDAGGAVERVVLVSRDLPPVESSNAAVLLAGLGLDPELEVDERLGGAPATLDAVSSARPRSLIIGVDLDPAGRRGDPDRRPRTAGAHRGAGGPQPAGPHPQRRRGGARLRRSAAAARAGIAGIAVGSVVGHARRGRRRGVRQGHGAVRGHAPTYADLWSKCRIIRPRKPYRVRYHRPLGCGRAGKSFRDHGRRWRGSGESTRTGGTSVAGRRGHPRRGSADLAGRLRTRLRSQSAVGKQADTPAATELDFPPRYRVGEDCSLSTDYELVPLPKTGTVYTEATVRIPVPGLRSPYSLVIVELDERGGAGAGEGDRRGPGLGGHR